MKSMRIVIPVVVVLGITGCSGEDLAENVIERQIESESGEDVDIDFDDGDISIQTEDGELSIETDDEGNISIQSENGDMSIDSDGGQTVIQSDDGSTIIGSSSGELPDDFPDEIPMPMGIALEYTQAMSTPEGETFVVGGTVDEEHEFLVVQYLAVLEASGFTQQQLTTTPDGSFFAYDNGTWTVGGSISDNNDGATAFGMTVTPSLG